MFLQLDTRFASLFQWMVRQFELYTKITRTHLFRAALFAFGVALFAFFVVSLFVLQSRSDMLSVAIQLPACIGLTLLYFNYMSVDSVKRNSKVVACLQIHDRRFYRYASLLFFAIVMCIAILLVIETQSPRHQEMNVAIFSELMNSILIVIITLNVIALEYLLCTYSLSDT